jgi:hypothetical protein
LESKIDGERGRAKIGDRAHQQFRLSLGFSGLFVMPGKWESPEQKHQRGKRFASHLITSATPG